MVYNKTIKEKGAINMAALNIDVNKFEQLTNNLFAKVQENQLENQKLANIRDTLLPKLMNGEVDLEIFQI